MVTPQQKAQCVSWFIETKSIVQTQRRYRTKYKKKSTITFFNSSMAQEIYGDRVSVGCSENWATKNICGKHRECKTSI